MSIDSLMALYIRGKSQAEAIMSFRDGALRDIYTGEGIDELKSQAPQAELMTFTDCVELISKVNEETFCKGFMPISAEQFFEALEVLPPCEWCTIKGVEVFYVSEHVTGNLVNWYCRVNDKHYSACDYDTFTPAQIVEKFASQLGL